MEASGHPKGMSLLQSQISKCEAILGRVKCFKSWTRVLNGPLVYTLFFFRLMLSVNEGYI